MKGTIDLSLVVLMVPEYTTSLPSSARFDENPSGRSEHPPIQSTDAEDLVRS